MEDGRDLGEQIEDASLEEALAWGRARSDVVLIRLWDSDYFSAGAVNPDPSEYPEWVDRPVERRRPRGLAALDNTEDSPPAPWDVRIAAGGGEVRMIVYTPTLRQAEAVADRMARACPRPGGYEVYPYAPDAPVLFGGWTRTSTPGR